jgi:hypothetical protein
MSVHWDGAEVVGRPPKRRDRPTTDIGRATFAILMCKRSRGRLFRLGGRPIGRPILFRLSVALQHGPGRGGQLGLHL